jgi:hypothetical protein
MKMNANTIKIWAIAALTGSCMAVNAQEPDEQLSREMTLEREYDPTVQDANKVNRLPEMLPPAVTKRTIDYSTFTIPANPQKEITLLPSGNTMTEIPYSKHRGYVHFGGGMFMSLNGDIGYHILNDDKNKLNLFFTHRSTGGNVEFTPENKQQKARLNDNLGGFHFGRRFDQNAVLRLGANYGYNTFNYYGRPSLLPLSSATQYVTGRETDRETDQVNQTLNIYGGVRSKDDATTGYILDVDFFNFAQQYGWAINMDGIRENKITLRAGIDRRFGNAENQQAGITGKADIFSYTNPSDGNTADSSAYRNSIEATLTPYYRIAGERWNIRLGANVMIITGDSAKVFVSPNVSAEAQIAEQTLFYVTAGGEIQSNDAHGLSQRNRYMDHLMAVKPSRTLLDATLGIRSGVAPGVWIGAFAGYKITEDDVFFIPATSRPYDLSRFMSYSTAFQPDASLFRIGATLKYAYRKQVEFSLKGVYNSWSLKEGDVASTPAGDEIKPYGRPAVELNADLTVKPLKPLTLALGYYLGADRHTLFYAATVKMPDINDLNLTASWNINDMFGAYVKLNNLFFRQQELFYGYPTQGFSAMAGISLHF